MRNKILAASGGLFALVLLLSNATGVPQAVTGAPGESGLSCNACHSGGNFNTSVQTQLIKDGVPVNAYQPGESYQLRVVVSGDNNPKAYGFQLVALRADNNADVGVWSNLGERVRTRNLLNRVYLQQSSPKTDGIFTAQWRAPMTDVGPVRFYFSGLAVNSNGNISGDQHDMQSLTLTSPGTTSTEEISTEYPSLKLLYNPHTAEIFIQCTDMDALQDIRLYDASGTLTVYDKISGNAVDVSRLSSGMYIAVLSTRQGRQIRQKVLIIR